MKIPKYLDQYEVLERVAIKMDSHTPPEQAEYEALTEVTIIQQQRNADKEATKAVKSPTLFKF